MALYLVESVQNGAGKDKEAVQEQIQSVRDGLGGKGVELVEVQVSSDFGRLFFILEGEEQASIEEGLKQLNVPVSLIKPVRLVGNELEKVRGRSDSSNYLVEWNLPEGITMDQYLERKKTNSVHYAEVPEVAFTRTYVCEDMTKCLCFYDAPDEAAVKKAREAVKAPVDAITPILPGASRP